MALRSFRLTKSVKVKRVSKRYKNPFWGFLYLIETCTPLDPIKLTLSGLELSVQMAEKTMTMQGMCESLYQTATAMTTSIEIAEKVAEEVNEEIEGLDALSAYIEKVLARVKITLLDTVLRVESEKGDTKIELRKVFIKVLRMS